ncbi:DNA polymerase kappa [Phytophthora ramorum]|uniref:DNA polymerase kappa n=1 Tax=Phytophthora ramorum TaxID=164328 RepID=UPI00309AB692|nr:DNA polymerase kappa [Phytophthora ramorum]
MASAKPSDDTPAAPCTDAAAAATSAMFVFTADKAGMKGVDKQHVQEVVHKMSKDSSFYHKSLRDNKKVEQRVVAMREKLACMTGGQQLRLQQEADARAAQMEATRDLSRTVVVVDMDMFYAAVEMRDNPTLRDVPLAVGGLNMISTTNYAARQFGVRAAMPGFIGKELCPELHFVPVDMEKYAGVTAQIRAVFAEYDPDFEAFSLDEACLDLTDYVANNWQKYISAAVEERIENGDEKRWASTAAGRATIAAAVVRELRQKIFDCTQLTASAGIAVNAMLAKICSDMNKPNGQYVLPFTRDRVMTFIRDLPVRKIGGIGKVMEKILSGALDVHTGGELFAQRGKICHLFSEKTAAWLLQTSLGVRGRREQQERKSFSRERTFRSLSDPKQLEDKCLEICKMLANDLEKAGKAAKHVTFVYKDTDFARCSRSMTLASAVFTADDLYANAVELLRRELPLTLRLMGVRAATLVPRPSGPNSFGNVGNITSCPDPGLASKKRQIVISKFAEHVTDSFAAVSSGSGGENNERDIKDNHILPASGYGSNPRSAPEVDTKPCPICGKLLNALNSMEVNVHMDACVLRSPSRSLSSSPLRHTTRKKAKAKANDIPHAFIAVQDSEKKADEDAKPCPICGKLLNARSNMEVNAHMDACVTRDRSPAPSPNRPTSKKRKISENNIDVFFRKNYND